MKIPGLAQKILISVLGLTLCAQTGFAYFSASVTQNSNDKNATSNFNFNLLPGESTNGSVTVSNIDKQSSTLILYGADALSSGSNAFVAKSAADPQTAVGQWISFSENQITLPAQGTQNIIFTVTIPKGTPPGSYAGAIAISSIPKSTVPGAAFGLITAYRTVIPVYVTIAGIAKSDFTISDLIFNNGTNPNLQLTINNTGNTIISAEGKLTIEGTKLISSTDIVKTKIYPGSSGTVQVPFDKNLTNVLVQDYKASATITINKVDISTGAETSLGTITKVYTISINHLIYVIYGLIGVAILLMIIVALIIISILRKKRMIKNAKHYTVATGDTIETVAEKNNIKWKKLAKCNKLKAPFSLTPGSIILIPNNLKK